MHYEIKALHDKLDSLSETITFALTNLNSGDFTFCLCVHLIKSTL